MTDSISAPDPRVDLTPIKAREAKATKGPWRVFSAEVITIETEDGDDVVQQVGEEDDEAIDQIRSDATFIARARQDIPVLVSALETAWVEIARLRAALVAPPCNCEGTMAGSHDPRCPRFHYKAALVAPSPQRYERDVVNRQGGHYGEEQWTEIEMVPCATGAWVKYSDVASVAAPSPQEEPKPMNCRRCHHPESWHRHDDADSTPPTDPACQFRCLGYDCELPGYPGGTPESRCGCPDFVNEGEDARWPSK